MKPHFLILLAMIALQSCDRSPPPAPTAASSKQTTKPPEPLAATMAPPAAKLEPRPPAIIGQYYRKLLTKSYEVTIIIGDVPEGVVVNDNITYIGKSKKTGKSIRLKGSELYSHGPDGTPGHPQGYEFINGGVTYLVIDQSPGPTLEIIGGKSHAMVEEDGTWIGE